MPIRNLCSSLLIMAVFALSTCAFAQGDWAIQKTFHVGGEGGFDYITVDAKSHRLYVPRSTHTMVIDADSGKTVADISGQKHNHGVAIVPELARGFISDGAGAIVMFDLKTNAVLATVIAKDDADGIIYDKSTGLVLVSCGDAGVLVTLKADADPKTAVIDAPIELGGKPEFLRQLDLAGVQYVGEVPTTFSCRPGRRRTAVSAAAVFSQPGVKRQAARSFRVAQQTGPAAVWQVAQAGAVPE